MHRLIQIVALAAIISVCFGVGRAEAVLAPEPEVEAAAPKVEREVEREVAGSLYVRSDSDGTTVIAPRIRFRQDFGRTGVDFVYSADVWTSASVDIRTAASPLVEERRDAIDLAVDHERGSVQLTGAYRVSLEADYASHGPTLGVAWEGLQRNLRVEGRASLSEDRVGRAGDPGFRRPLRTVSTWLGVTQLLGRGTLLQVAVEQRSSFGYHASPYRWVGLGGSPRCAGLTPLCVPEVAPEQRYRQAASLRLRQALGKRASVGAGYRFYYDSWRLQSHTALADLRFVLGRSVLLELGYRAYFQGAAWFYRSRYELAALPAFVTRDRELSSMFDHGGTLLIDWHRELARAPVELGAGLHTELIYYGYDDFPGLDRVLAGQGTLNLHASF